MSGYPTTQRRDCEECAAVYVPRSRTQRYCEGCRLAPRECVVCTGAFTVPRAELARRLACYCSMECKARASGGVYFNQGRWWVVCRDGTKMAYARAVVAGRIGRLLARTEWVHHDNEDPTDDRDENLQLMSPKQHLVHHAARRKAMAA